MKRYLLTLAVICSLLLCSGCGDTYESLAEESVSVMKQLLATLESVKDGASARAAKPKLQALDEEMKDIEKRMSALGTPSEADIEALDASIGKEMEELSMKISEAMMRIMFNEEIQKELADLDLG